MNYCSATPCCNRVRHYSVTAMLPMYIQVTLTLYDDYEYGVAYLLVLGVANAGST